MKRIILLSILLLQLKVTASAQDIHNLSLEDAIQLGLSNNKALQSEHLTTDIDKYKRKEYSAAFYPTVTGNAGITSYIQVPVQYAPANVFNPSAPSDQYTGLKLLMPNSSTLGVGASWQLYNQAIYSAFKILKAQNEINTIQYQKDKTELAYSISQLYYGIVFAEKQKGSLLKIDSNITRLISFLQSNYDNGLIKKSELDKVKVNKASNASQISELTSTIETQYRLLKLFIGLSKTQEIKFSNFEFEHSLSPVIASTSSIDNTYDYQLLQNQIKLNKLERKSVSASYYPSLSLVYNYSYNWVSQDLGKLLSSNLNYQQQYVGLNLTVPVFDGNRNLYKLKQNTIAAKQLGLQSDYLSEKINTDISNAQLKYNASLNNISSNNLNVKLGEDVYAQSLFQYEQGTITLNDVLTSETSLEEALTEYYRSMSNALTALLDYKKATNTILTK